MTASGDPELKELQKNQRLSLQHLRRGVIVFGITAVALIVAQYFINVRLWIPFSILGVVSFTLVGDAFNYLFCGRKIRRIQNDRSI